MSFVPHLVGGVCQWVVVILFPLSHALALPDPSAQNTQLPLVLPSLVIFSLLTAPLPY
jgi:hypothetical protein